MTVHSRVGQLSRDYDAFKGRWQQWQRSRVTPDYRGALLGDHAGHTVRRCFLLLSMCTMFLQTQRRAFNLIEEQESLKNSHVMVEENIQMGNAALQSMLKQRERLKVWLADCTQLDAYTVVPVHTPPLARHQESSWHQQLCASHD